MSVPAPKAPQKRPAPKADPTQPPPPPFKRAHTGVNATLPGIALVSEDLKWIQGRIEMHRETLQKNQDTPPPATNMVHGRLLLFFKCMKSAFVEEFREHVPRDA